MDGAVHEGGASWLSPGARRTGQAHWAVPGQCGVAAIQRGTRHGCGVRYHLYGRAGSVAVGVGLRCAAPYYSQEQAAE